MADFDTEHNTTSIPSSGIYSITAEQFFCSLVKEADVRCISSGQFADQPLHQLCPSGDCWTDCQDLNRLYAPLPSGINFANKTSYGTAPTITFWNLCNGLANLTQAALDGVPSQFELDQFQSFLSNNTVANLRAVADATTSCWSATCNQARDDSDCAPKCAAVNLLESRISPQLAGTRECIKSVCLDIDGLPFANQDIVGIGVSISYVIQISLVILIWTALTFATIKHRRKSQPSIVDRSLPTSWTSVLESISGFHTAQCFLSIPLAVAAFFSNPFTLDPLNAFGLLPVALNGLLPITFTLLILYHYQDAMQETIKWYPIILADISYSLNTVLLFAVVTYLLSVRDKGIALKESAFRSLGGIDSCGGLTAISLCLAFQADSPPAFLVQQIPGLVFVGTRLVIFVWIICTICLAAINIRQWIQSTSGRKSEHLSASRHDVGTVVSWIRRLPEAFQVLSGSTAYYFASVIFILALVFQATMFYTYLALGLVDLQTWSLGQIVAVTVWIPPIVDYLHLQLGKDTVYGELAEPEVPKPKLDALENSVQQDRLLPQPSTSSNQEGDPEYVSDQEDDVEDVAWLARSDDFPLEQMPYRRPRSEI